MRAGKAEHPFEKNLPEKQMFSFSFVSSWPGFSFQQMSLILNSTSMTFLFVRLPLKGGAVSPRHSGSEELRPSAATTARRRGRRSGGGVCQDCSIGEKQGALGEAE